MPTLLGRQGVGLKRGGKGIYRPTVASSSPHTQLDITTTDLPDGVVGVAYSVQVQARGGAGIRTWTATNLPPGLSIDASTGVISGIPTGTGGTYNPVISVTDSTRTASKGFTGVVVSTSSLVISTSALPAGQIGTAYSTTMAAANGTTPYTWSATGLGSGLSINPSTGVISGIPSGSSGNRSVTVTVTDSNTVSVSRSYTLAIAAAPTALSISTTSLPNATIGGSYSKQMVAAGGTGTYTWSQAGGFAGTGLGMDSSGLITGSAEGSPRTVTLSIRVTDGTSTVTQNFSLVIQANTMPVMPSKRFGVAKNAATAGKVGILADRIAQTGLTPASTDRLHHVREDFAWNGTHQQSDGDAALSSDDQALITMARNKGLKLLVGGFFTKPEHSRAIRFTGTTVAGGVNWTGGVGTNKKNEDGTALNPARPGGGNRPGYYAPNAGATYSIYGPGIDYMEKTGSVQAGNTSKIVCAVPATGDPGFGVSWVGKPVTGPGLQTGTKVSGVASDGFLIDKPSTVGSNRKYKFGTVRGISAQNGSTGFDVTGGVVAGHSGEFYVGGIQPGAAGGANTKMQPSNAAMQVLQDWVHDMCVLIGTDVMWGWETNNEPNHPMGAGIFADAAQEYKRMVHTYIGAKRASMSIVVVSGGTAARGDSQSKTNWDTSPEFYGELVNQCKTVQPNYFRNAWIAAFGSDAGMPSHGFPADAIGIHIYNDGPKTDSGSMRQAAEVWNIFANGLGAGIPIACTENGPWWMPSSTTAMGGTKPWSPAAGYQWVNDMCDVLWGNVRWPHLAFVGEPDISSTTATQAQRQASARRIFWPWTCFAVQAPPPNPSDTHSSLLGIAWHYDGTQKYVHGVNDPVEALRTAA